MRRLLSAALLTALLAAHPAAADQSPVVGRGELVAGRSLSQWDVRWNSWAFGVSQSSTRQTEQCLAQPGDSPVRFLGVRSRDEHVYEVHCTVAATQYLMLGQPGALCNDARPLRPYTTTAQGLRRCARDFWRQIADPKPRVVLDGTSLGAGPTVHTGAFRFSVPPRDNQFDRPGVRRVRAAAVARATILRPLSPGEHTLIQAYRYRGEHNQVVVYKLTVV
jgi:hypothetical protein